MTRYLLTGGAGTIGLALAGEITKREPRSQVRLLDNSEYSLFEGTQKLNSPGIEYRLGDIRDRDSVQSAFEGVDSVVHLAALKHVSFTNAAPHEVIETNVVGTENVLQAFLSSRSAKRLVNVSSDKACLPTTLYGTTKLIGEHLTHARSLERPDLHLASVRFGNVVGSRGSVLERWLGQAFKSRAVTVTNPKMRRFVMTQDEAVHLIRFSLGSPAASGRICVKIVPAATVGQLLDAFQAWWIGRGHSPVEVIQGASLSGEKLDEDLISGYELAHSETRNGIRILSFDSGLESKSAGLSTLDAHRIGQKQLRRIVSDCLDDLVRSGPS